MSRVILPFSNPLSYPGRAPGFDPSHVASRGIGPNRGISAIATFSNVMVSLSGSGTSAASIAEPVDSLIGPVVGSAGGINFTGQSTASISAKTLAGIFRVTSLTGSYQNLIQDNFADALLIQPAENLSFYASGDNPIPNPAALVAGRAYFVAASASGTKINCVVVDLATGRIYLNSVSEGTGLNAPSGTIEFDNGSAASFAAGMVGYNYLSLQQLQQWAQDPWSFWYPRTLDLSMMLKSGSIADILYAQALL